MQTRQGIVRLMQRVAPVLLFLAIAAAGVVAQTHEAHEDWIKYDSKEGRYTVMLPGKPDVGTQEGTSADGMKLTQYKAGVYNADVAYMIGYFDYQPPTTFTFDKARDGMISAVRGSLVSERTITLSGFPGREMRINAKDESGIDYDMRARFYDVNQRIYVLQFIALKSTPLEIADPKAARYFDSFHLITGSN
jgi:hypothetical protein